MDDFLFKGGGPHKEILKTKYINGWSRKRGNRRMVNDVIDLVLLPNIDILAPMSVLTLILKESSPLVNESLVLIGEIRVKKFSKR